MSQATADRCRGLPTIVVSDAFRLAPWAVALVSTDHKWWIENPEAADFPGAKFSVNRIDRVRRVEPNGLIGTDTNSGLLALHVALTVYRAARVLLFGFDMQGTHYFGPHKTLPNTTESRFEVFRTQFSRYAKGVTAEVVNCTPASTLTCFPKGVACLS
ncbi:MAG: hypothetical protein AB7O55_32750 [Lautropia sp.]